MAGTILVLDSVSGITATTTTRPVTAGSGAFTSANFFVDIGTVSGGTSTWNITLQYVSPEGNTITVATLSGINSENTQFVELAKDAAFTSVTDAVPMPNQVQYIEASGTDSLTARIVAFVVQ